ncbi:MAG: T9SS C-terminal target domain-containing protein [Cryomorphaceae bacterium]|nr:MAG: T9SS C-terminal target domain-containing protein [Cryomorphaceae bacterium]
MIRYPFRILFIILACANISVGQQFADIANQLGINPQYNSANNWGAGVSFFDINQDGWDDITYARDYDSLLIYFNHEGVFTRHALPLPDSGMLKNALWVDYDNDGHFDLFLSFFEGKFYLLRNNGNFDFTDVTDMAGLSNLPAFNYGVTVADVNRDGFLDIYISRYSGLPHHPYHQKYNLLFLGSSEGVFTDVTLESGLNNTVRPTFLSVIFDYDMDGWPDIYEINDRTLFDNIMHKNMGNAMFSDATAESNSSFAQGHPMTATVGDYDNDGFLDVFMTNSTYNPSLDVTTTLLRNSGNGAFSDVSGDVGVAFHEFSWGGLWMDYDNDGLQDLYIATSPIVQNAPVYKDIFVKQLPDHTFEPDSTVFGNMLVQRNYSVARGDLNNDGFYDLVTHSIAPYQSNVWLNSGNENNFVKITIKGTISNRMAIGSWIRVFSNGQQYTQYTMCGENYISQNSQHHIFGLGSASAVDSVHVEYLSGHTDKYYNLEANQHYYFQEGETHTVSLLGHHQPNEILCSGDSLVLFSSGNHFSYLWNTGDTTQHITVSQSGLYHLTTWNEFGLHALSDTVEVVVLPETEVTLNVSGVVCPGESNGIIQLLASTGTPQQVIWNHGAMGTLLDGLNEGVYSFIGLDSAGCPIEGNVYVPEPPPFQHSIKTTDVLCFGESTGGAALSVTGATPPYSIDWGDFNPTQLPAGNFEVSVTDQNNCEWVLNFTIDQPDPLIADVSTSPSAEDEASGSAELDVSGGVPPYSVEWSNGVIDSSSLDALPPGIYHVWVTDSNQCEVFLEFEIDATTHIQPGHMPTLSLYPNPTRQWVWIQGCKNHMIDWVVHDATGRIVLHSSGISCNEPIDVSKLSPGMYTIRISRNLEMDVFRVVITR